MPSLYAGLMRSSVPIKTDRKERTKPTVAGRSDDRISFEVRIIHETEKAVKFCARGEADRWHFWLPLSAVSIARDPETPFFAVITVDAALAADRALV